MKYVRLFVGLSIATALTAFALADTSWDYYAEKGLQEKVQLEVGRTGAEALRETWEIEPSGEWTYTARGTTSEFPAKGKLSDRQQQALAHQLAAQEFSTLVGQFGLPAEDLLDAEPRWFISLRVGSRRAVFISKEPPLLAAPPLVREKDRDKDGFKDGPSREEQTARKWPRLAALATVIPAILRGDSGAPPRDKDKTPPADKDKDK